MPRRVPYVPFHRFNLSIPAQLYEQLLVVVPPEQSLTSWIEQAIREKLAQMRREGE